MLIFSVKYRFLMAMSQFNPTNKDQLEDDLHTVLLRAYENGVTINDGGIELRDNSPATPDWEIMIYQLQGLFNT